MTKVQNMFFSKPVVSKTAAEFSQGFLHFIFPSREINLIDSVGQELELNMGEK